MKPEDSASVYIPGTSNTHAEPSSVASIQSNEIFAYKIKDSSGRVLRFIASSTKYKDVLSAVKMRFLNSGIKIKGKCRLSYEDDDGDYVSLLSDSDLEEAVLLARSLKWSRLNLMADFSRDGGRMFTNEAIGGLVFGTGILVMVSFLLGRLAK